jgi:hypothetical protein
MIKYTFYALSSIFARALFRRRNRIGTAPPPSRPNADDPPITAPPRLLWRGARRLGRLLLAATGWSLSAIAIAAVLAYILLRDPITGRLDVRRAPREMREALTGTLPIEQSEAKIAAGRRGYFAPVLRYTPALATVIRRADHAGQDLLTDFESFQVAWREECGGTPLILTFVHPTLTEPYSKQQLRRAVNSPEAVTQANFDVVVPLLRDIRSLILDTNARGRGVLATSGYAAEPDESRPADPVHPPRPDGRQDEP